MSGLGDLAPIEVLQVQSAQANAAVAFLASVASTGARTPRATIQTWQRDWNGRRESIMQALRQTGGTGGTNLANAIATQGPLVVDGYWGRNTAFTSVVMVGTSSPPTRLADVPAWWRSNGAALATRRDAISAALTAARARPADPPAPPPPAAPPPPPPEPAPPPPPADPSVPYDSAYDPETRRNSSSTTASGGDEGGMGGAIFAMVAIAAVGVMYAMKKGGLNGLGSPSGKKSKKGLSGGGMWERGDGRAAYAKGPRPVDMPSAVYEVLTTDKRFTKGMAPFATVSEAMTAYSRAKMSGSYRSAQLVEIRNGKRKTLQTFAAK